MHSIYNKSAEDMSEVRSNSVNLIVASTPYNDGTVYGQFVDKTSLEQYCQMMERVIAECARVLHPEGRLIIEVADTAIVQGHFVQLAALWQQAALRSQLHLSERHINFVQTHKGNEDATHGDGFISPPVTAELDETHSNSCQWLVFTKKSSEFLGGNIYYQNYVYDLEEHHCPYTDEFCRTFFEIGHFKSGDTVLEVFMGTATLGLHVLEREGIYIGYEIDSIIFARAQQRLAR
ncbi:MAG TPA: DNA methyltransferase [Candidatus Paceibacterota bacterium]|nr:DNA methyltransferase [Candidatus Paceibacterota bacterium]